MCDPGTNGGKAPPSARASSNDLIPIASSQICSTRTMSVVIGRSIRDYDPAGARSFGDRFGHAEILQSVANADQRLLLAPDHRAEMFELSCQRIRAVDRRGAGL